MVVVPHEPITFDYPASGRRLPSGVPRIDDMLDGGFFDKSLVLLSGPSGVGKSALTTHFVAGIRNDEKALYFTFEESHDQVRRNARGWGIDLDGLEAAGRVRVVSSAPEAATLELHLLRMKEEMEDFGPDRVAVDSVTALQRVATAKSFGDYLLGMSFHIKSQATLGLLTATTDNLGGGMSTGALHLSTVSDTVLLLQYVLKGADVLRSITVLKERGSDHDKAVREYRIGPAGMEILEPLALSGFADLPQVL